MSEKGDAAPEIRARPFGNAPHGAAGVALSAEQRHALARIARLVHFAHGQTIYLQGDPLTHVYTLAAGVVATYRMNDEGVRHITALLFPGDCFGVAEAGRYFNAAEAVTEAEAWQIPFRELAALLEADPRLEWNFLVKALDGVRQAQRHAILLDRHGAVQRIALFLEYLRREMPANGGRIVPLPMSRSVIADYTGLSLESVSRSLSALRDAGAIRMEGPHAVEVLDPARLREAAEG
ncbi:MAG: Crp/Fnr family transcriptional regulator [Rhodospirillales bacterium]|nr:Crp/Fnr family transcriptional regulator [Rhodospirillales bacterium]